MFCSKCGNHLDESARFCGKCGAKQVGEEVAEIPAIKPVCTSNGKLSSIKTNEDAASYGDYLLKMIYSLPDNNVEAFRYQMFFPSDKKYQIRLNGILSYTKLSDCEIPFFIYSWNGSSFKTKDEILFTTAGIHFRYPQYKQTNIKMKILEGMTEWRDVSEIAFSNEISLIGIQLPGCTTIVTKSGSVYDFRFPRVLWSILEQIWDDSKS